MLEDHAPHRCRCNGGSLGRCLSLADPTSSRHCLRIAVGALLRRLLHSLSVLLLLSPGSQRFKESRGKDRIRSSCLQPLPTRLIDWLSPTETRSNPTSLSWCFFPNHGRADKGQNNNVDFKKPGSQEMQAERKRLQEFQEQRLQKIQTGVYVAVCSKEAKLFVSGRERTV